jgi:FkbM family methyltransferase
MREYINPSGTFVDVGAHIGTYTWLLGPYAKEVYAFEPTRRIYNHLCANVLLKDLSDKVETYNIGLSDVNGKLPFYERQPDGGTNGFTHIGWKEDISYELPVLKMDEFDIKDISLIKIDVEGHELEVIKGASETLKNNDYPPILFESWEPVPDQPLIGDLRTELFNHLYEIGYAIEHTAHPEIFLAKKEKL